MAWNAPAKWLKWAKVCNGSSPAIRSAPCWPVAATPKTVGRARRPGAAGATRPFPWAKPAAVPEVFATAYLNLYKEGSPRHQRAGACCTPEPAASAPPPSSFAARAATPTYVHRRRRSQAQSVASKLGASGGCGPPTKVAFADQVGRMGPAAKVFDVILDPRGRQLLRRQPGEPAHRTDRLVLIGLMGGIQADIPLAPSVGEAPARHRARPCAPAASPPRQRSWDGLEIHLWPKLESGAIKPIIETVVPMADAQKGPTTSWPATRPSARVVLEW